MIIDGQPNTIGNNDTANTAYSIIECFENIEKLFKIYK